MCFIVRAVMHCNCIYSCIKSSPEKNFTVPWSRQTLPVNTFKLIMLNSCWCKLSISCKRLHIVSYQIWTLCYIYCFKPFLRAKPQFVYRSTVSICNCHISPGYSVIYSTEKIDFTLFSSWRLKNVSIYIESGGENFWSTTRHSLIHGNSV